MRVNYINKNEVNNIYIHDSIFYGYQCDYNNRTISFFCENKPSGKKTYFKFNNVIFCSMQSCLFWGGGNNIIDLYVKENEIEKEQLIEIQKCNKVYHDFSRLLKEGAFFTVELQINSGDTLTIICEDLDYNILQ